MVTDDRLLQLRDTTAIDSVSYLEIRQMVRELIGYRAAQQGGGTAPPANVPHLDKINSELRESFRRIDKRIDQVVEIIGARIDKLKGAHARYNALELRLMRLEQRGEPFQMLDTVKLTDAPFPTGGASTAEAAADAVLPVPQRGDRVTLNGATTVQDRLIPPGLYSVVGQDGEQFQIVLSTSGAGSILVWVRNDSYGLQGITHDVD